MSIKSLASKQFSTHLLDERRRDKGRARAERERRRKGEPHRIEFFLQVDDPYSHLLAQALVQRQLAATLEAPEERSEEVEVGKSVATRCCRGRSSRGRASSTSGRS